MAPQAVVERCQHLGPKVHTLITMGSQHQGVANIPGCGWVKGCSAMVPGL